MTRFLPLTHRPLLGQPKPPPAIAEDEPLRVLAAVNELRRSLLQRAVYLELLQSKALPTEDLPLQL